MKDTSGKFNVLSCDLASKRDIEGVVGETHCCNNCTLLQQTTENLNLVTAKYSFNALASCHIGVCRVPQECGDELGCVRKCGRRVGSIEDVIGKESFNS